MGETVQHCLKVPTSVTLFSLFCCKIKKMQRFPLFVIFLLTYSYVSAQVMDISIARPPLKAIDSIEQANNGKITSYNGITVRISSGYFPGSDNFHLGQPLISIRKTTPLKVVLNYFYSLPDSAIRLIEYTWNASPEEKNKLTDIFETNARHFSKLFAGDGTITQENHDTWSQKTIAWENDRNYVKQFMVIGAGTYRVRVLVSWK